MTQPKFLVRLPLYFAFPTLLLAVTLLAGCATPKIGNLVLGPDYEPGNVFRLSERLPPNIRRVAVLPLTSTESQQLGAVARETLEPVLLTELLKTKKFDVATVPAADLARWTGRSAWMAQDALPTNLLAVLREKFACDAVLFCSLSRYRPYPPLALGWQLKLVQATDGQNLWAIDEVFDAGEPTVTNSARRYEQQHQKGGPLTDSPLVLTSPARFGQYTVAAALKTLPER